jgi:hypothetical protein
MSGGRPSKPLALVKGHRTKAEKEIRQKAERELITGLSLKEADEVKNNSVAHKEFVRLRKLLKAVKMDDDLYSNMVNTLCMLKAERVEYENIKATIPAEMIQIKQMLDNDEIDTLTYLDKKQGLEAKYLACDKNIMAKRKMELDISKENIMTIQSALRSIPKKPEDNINNSPMATFLKRKASD